MLKLKYLYENYELAKTALLNWEHDENGLDEMLTHYRISSNAIYPFNRNGETCFLRLAPVSEKHEQNELGELELLDYLHNCGFPALEVVPSVSGEKLLTLNTDSGDWYAAAFRKVNGVPIEYLDITPEILNEYGKTLGRLHELSACFKPIVKKQSHIDVLSFIRKTFAEYNAPESACDELLRVTEKLAALPRTVENYGLVHYDFEPDNVFYDSDTKTCNVIDFDDGMYHWFALDIAQVFDSLGDFFDGEALVNAQAEFLAGYRNVHTFTAQQEEALPLMLRFINLYGYARLIRSVAEKFDNEPEWLIGLRQKLGNAISAKEQSFISFSEKP